MSYNEADLKRRMDGALESFNRDVTGLRTGRASTSMLEPVVVDVYGSKMPLNQVGTISAPEARLLTVQVWDMSVAPSVDKAIRDSNLGLNPQTEGAMIRVPIPELNEERRNDLVKVARGYAEQGRIAVRNVRRDGMESLKKMEKDGEISEDDLKRMSDDVQKLTDAKIKEIDDRLAEKEKDITTI